MRDQTYCWNRAHSRTEKNSQTLKRKHFKEKIKVISIAFASILFFGKSFKWSLLIKNELFHHLLISNSKATIPFFFQDIPFLQLFAMQRTQSLWWLRNNHKNMIFSLYTQRVFCSLKTVWDYQRERTQQPRTKGLWNYIRYAVITMHLLSRQL